METRKANIIFNKNGRGSETFKITLPVPWIKKLGFTENQKEAEIILFSDKIIIKKK